MRSPLLTLGVWALLGCSQAPAIDHATELARLRAHSSALAAAEVRQALDTVMAFWSDSAVVHQDGAPAVRGREAIRGLYINMWFPFTESFRPEMLGLTMSASGDLAYELGANHLVLKGKRAPLPYEAKYVAVWAKESDGVWRLVVLAITGDVPFPAGEISAGE